MCALKIYLEKVQERWWEKLIESEEKLDLTSMNPEKPMDELDEVSQAKIRQLMYDEQQKRLGLPTSEEQVSFFLSFPLLSSTVIEQISKFLLL